MPWVVWSVCVLAYIVAVAQRTTLGVAGLEAADRFDVGPGILSTFVVIQLALFTVAQIPAGVFVDRFGARVGLVLSASLMAVGQGVQAWTTDLPIAILARVLVGFGDAVMFSAAFSLVPRWFPPARVPVMVQLGAMLCQLGQVVSAVPFAAVLRGSGWTAAFGSAAAVSAAIAVLAVVVVRDAPAGRWTPGPPLSVRAVSDQITRVWRRPGTRLGFFCHMAVQFSMMTFTLLWGVPFLVTGQGLAPSTASGLLVLFVGVTLAVAPFLGVISSRRPARRVQVILGVVVLQALTWGSVLAHPGPAPFWLLCLLVSVLAVGGPTAVIGIDIGRTANPPANAAVAQSIANTGGFLASLVVVSGIGMALSAAGGFTPEAFRVAMLVQYPVWLVAGILAWRTSRAARTARE